MTITAIITATGTDSSAPDHTGAVDATIYCDDVEVGEVTLLPRQYDGQLDAWGDDDCWATHQLQAWLDEQEDETDMGREAAIDAVIHAVQRAATSAWSVGDAVEAGEGDDHDTGRVVGVGVRSCTVAWDSGVTTPCPTTDLRAL